MSTLIFAALLGAALFVVSAFAVFYYFAHSELADKSQAQVDRIEALQQVSGGYKGDADALKAENGVLLLRVSALADALAEAETEGYASADALANSTSLLSESLKANAALLAKLKEASE